ncbi:hypothetical protein ACFL2Q_19190 [Thermodesulfobacteriota bacterium]
MSEYKNIGGDKAQIMEQVSDLSRLLAMIPSDDKITVSDPMTHNSMELSKWFSDARNSFLKLSILVGKALDLNLDFANEA